MIPIGREREGARSEKRGWAEGKKDKTTDAPDNPLVYKHFFVFTNNFTQLIMFLYVLHINDQKHITTLQLLRLQDNEYRIFLDSRNMKFQTNYKRFSS